MGALSNSEARFDEARQSSKFYEAWEELKHKQPALERFREPEDLRNFCRDALIPYENQDPLVLALCKEVRQEAKAKADRRHATDLLTWIFLPALWGVAEQASTIELLPPWEVEAEVLSGFWEMAIREHRTSEGLSGRLVNAGRHQVWRLIRSRLKEDHPTLDALESKEAITQTIDPVWADPWVLLCWARIDGEIKETDAELIFWTRLQGEPLEKVSALLGLGYETGRTCRKRAERKLARWVRWLGDNYPPKDPKLARECLELAQIPSKLARKPSDCVTQNGPEMCWEG